MGQERKHLLQNGRAGKLDIYLQSNCQLLERNVPERPVTRQNTKRRGHPYVPPRGGREEFVEDLLNRNLRVLNVN